MDNGAGSYHRFLEGDEQGIVEIVRDYKDGLILYLNGIVLNIHIAEELAEETFIKLVVSKPRFNGKSTFKTWLYGIGRNVTKDYLRHSARYTSVSIEDYDGLSDEQNNLEKQYIQEERKLVIHRALSKLSSEYRQMLYLKYFEDMDNSQIAIIMKKNARQIANNIYKAKQSLKTELEKEGFSYEEL